MSDTPKVGQLIGPDEKRDCIHVAIAPVIATCILKPGQLIGWDDVMDDREHVTSLTTEPIGIVDPFLRDGVRTGDRFYMFLLPGTITSLRHMWTHPAFAPTKAIR
jgi:hypothetical protein